MYTLLIAEDEQLERDALEFIINKGNRGVRCIKAKNGREAVELARKHTPDIAFLDIQMPGMSGLEAAKFIKEICPSCQLAFLTAWGDFGFAQEAIRLGASDYLVKPCSDSDIYTILDKCIANLQKQKVPEAEFKRVLNLFTREFFASLKFGNLSDDAIHSYLKLQGIENEQGFAMIISNKDAGELSASFSTDSELMHMPVCYFVAPDRITILVFTNRQQQVVDRMVQGRVPFIESCPSVGIGMFFDSISGIQQSIHTASIAFTTALHNGLHIERFSGVDNVEPISDIRVAVGVLSKGMRDAALEGKLEESRQFGHELVDTVISHYEDIHSAEDAVYEQLLVFSYDIRNVVPYIYRDAPTRSTLMEMEIYLMDFLDEVCTAVNTDRQDKYARAFNHVDTYIKAHYAQPLSAEEMADFVNINRGYFSKLFKEYFSVPFVEYLTDIRMKKAAALLMEGKSVRETASLTGFSDNNYFSRVFRQRFGCSPKYYKSGQSRQ